MTNIVIRGLTAKETHDLRVLKAQLGEPNWRKLLLRLVKERDESKAEIMTEEYDCPADQG